MALSNELGVGVIGFVAGGTIVKNRAVKLHSTAGQIVAAAAIADLVIGVALQSGSAGDTIPVQIFGVAKVEIAAAVTLGSEVMVQAAAGNGKADVAVGATARSFGVAIEAGTADTHVIAVLLRGGPSLKGPPNA